MSNSNVKREEEYVHSSCGDRYGVRKGRLELIDLLQGRLKICFYLGFDMPCGTCRTARSADNVIRKKVMVFKE